MGVEVVEALRRRPGILVADGVRGRRVELVAWPEGLALVVWVGGYEPKLWPLPSPGEISARFALCCGRRFDARVVVQTAPKSSRAAGRPRLENASPIAVRRFLRDLTQEALAEKLGITRQYLGLIEQGRATPSLGLRLRLALALEADYAEIFPEYESSPGAAPGSTQDGDEAAAGGKA